MTFRRFSLRKTVRNEFRVCSFAFLYAPVYSFSLFKFLYSDGVQFLAALKILLKVDRLLNPESIATSVMEI